MNVAIWLSGRLIGRTVAVGRSTKIRIEFAADLVDEFGAGVPLLSCALPTPGPSAPARSAAYLEGLLPEGRALTAAAARVGGASLTADGHPSTPTDTLRLLAQYGRECAGAVTIVPADERPRPDDGWYQRLDDDDVAQLLADLPVRPLGADPDRGIRMSLGGVQDKLLLALINGRWELPIDGSPSTHILKPTAAWRDSAPNEALCMSLARAAQLTTSDVWVQTLGGTPTLVAERYDRSFADDGRVLRHHQEDLCQAMGARPGDKYALGPPGSRMARVLREWADSPSVELARLFAQVAFRCIVGDADGHGKNYSVLHDGAQVRMAPIYDSLCTLYYPALDDTMAMPIGGRTTLATVDRQGLLDEAAAMGVPRTSAAGTLDSLVADMRVGMDAAVEASAGAGDWPADRVARLIGRRLDRLEQGKPLGPGPSTRRRGD